MGERQKIDLFNVACKRILDWKERPEEVLDHLFWLSMPIQVDGISIPNISNDGEFSYNGNIVYRHERRKRKNETLVINMGEITRLIEIETMVQENIQNRNESQ